MNQRTTDWSCLLRPKWLVAVSVCLLSGCTLLGVRPKSTIPTMHELRVDQLVVYTDFQMPKRHRLLDDLAARRLDVHTILGLPTSDESIYVYLFDSSDNFRDYIRHEFPGFPDRRAFFVESDTRLAVYAYWGDRVAEDLRHEIVHGYLHAVVPNLPLWLDEGLAEYFEVPRGMNGLNMPHVDLLIEQFDSGEWKPGLQRLEAMVQPIQMEQRDYAESWAWVHWLLEASPEDRGIIRNHLARLRMTGKSPSLEAAIHEAHPNAAHKLMEHLRELKRKQSA